MIVNPDFPDFREHNSARCTPERRDLWCWEHGFGSKECRCKSHRTESGKVWETHKDCPLHNWCWVPPPGEKTALPERSGEELKEMGLRIARLFDENHWSVRDSLGCLAFLIVNIADTSDVMRQEVYEVVELGFKLVDQRKRGPS